LYLVSCFSAYIAWQEQVTFSLHNDACFVLDQHTGPDFYSYTLLKQVCEGIHAAILRQIILKCRSNQSLVLVLNHGCLVALQDLREAHYPQIFHMKTVISSLSTTGPFVVISITT
jgi:hypothetical protein